MQLHHSKTLTAIGRSVVTIVTGSYLATVVPTIASSQSIGENSPTAQFYCGKTADPSSRSTLPATVVKVSGYSEEPVFIIWKSEGFGRFTPQKRCEIVSPKIQAAYQAGRNFIRAGIEKQSGLGIICAVANAETACDRNNMLFTLKTYQNAENTVEEIQNLLQGTATSPRYESNVRVVDLRQFASFWKK